MTPPDVSDAAVEAALDAFVHTPTGTSGDDEMPALMRAAIAAAVEVMFAPEKYQFREKFMAEAWSPWYTLDREQDRDMASEKMNAADGWQAQSRDLYRLRTQENADG